MTTGDEAAKAGLDNLIQEQDCMDYGCRRKRRAMEVTGNRDC